MITVEQFYTIAKRCGYEVYTDDNTFYHLYYRNDQKMAKQMGRYFDASYSPKEVNLYEPVSYTYFTPDTCHSKEYDDPKEFDYLLTEEEKKECEKYPFLYHAYLSAYNYKLKFPYDEDIFNAIHNHVFGRLNMSKLEEIIMISDFTEKNRTYDDCIRCRKILLDGDMNKAIYESLVATINHCKGEAHPEQLKLLEEYKERLK
jgi:HD superfamily phosphohydrolase YqeK